MSKTSPKLKLWLAGFGCLRCGRARYEGYDIKAKTTTPCPACGDVRPASISEQEFRKLIAKRNSDPEYLAWVDQWVKERISRQDGK
jgi:hypothetical protein